MHLPEKVNSIIWVRHRRTLAFRNVTGAMVFQGTLLPALGIIMTPWQLVKRRNLSAKLRSPLT